MQLARFAKARMIIVAFLTLMVALLGGVPSTLAAPSPATGPASGGPNYTHHMVEKLRVSDAFCAKLQAAFPAEASNPDLCFVTHGTDWTDPQPSSADAQQAQQASRGKAAPGMAIMLACPSGTVTFHDYFTSFLRIEIDLDTQFWRNGACGVPTLNYEHCYVSFSLSAEYKYTSCYSYTYPATNPNRRSAVYTGTVYYYDGPGITVTQLIGQRRECYSTGGRNWTWWD